MKHNFIKTVFVTGAISLMFASCELIIDKDTTDKQSVISYKPEVQLLGEPIVSLQQGENYTDAGVNATAGDNGVSVEIESGEVNQNEIGFYVVTYRAENEYGWASYTYRTVLVHDGTPYEVAEIESDKYKIGFLFKATISKHAVNGYWSMTNVWAEAGVDFPIVFVEDPIGDGLLVVPGDHPTKGRYSGFGVINGNKLKFTIIATSPEGVVTEKEFEWKR